MTQFRFLAALLIAGAALATVSPAAAEPTADRIDVGFDPEPGDPTYGFVPARVASGDVIAVFVDRTGPMISGIILVKDPLQPGSHRTIEISGVQSHPFAITQAYDPMDGLVALVEK